MNNKIKVKSISQNNKKKPLKQNWNTISGETALVDNILKVTRPVKDSKGKLNTTMAIYTKAKFLPTTVSNRDAQNQSQNSRSSKKKDLNYVKQMMNKTVLIPNQDYQPFNQNITGFNNKISQRVDSKKKNSLVIPKQVMMVSSYFHKFNREIKIKGNS